MSRFGGADVDVKVGYKVMTAQQETGGNLEKSRRDKLQRIQELGVDPWGGRFDGRQSIRELRDRIGEVKFQSEAGEQIELPDPEADPDLNFRQWLADQGKGELVGPTVRAAGRIVLMRDTGKLKFIDIRDQTGQIQLFVGKKQVGEAAWQLSDCFDLGDMIGVDGQLRRTKTGEVTIFAEKPAFSLQVARIAAGKTSWLERIPSCDSGCGIWI